MDAKSDGRREELEIAKIEEGACTSTTAKTDGGIAFSSASIVTMSQKVSAILFLFPPFFSPLFYEDNSRRKAR